MMKILGTFIKRSMYSFIRDLRNDKFKGHNRKVSLGDLIWDRWETAEFYGFGKGTSCYDNTLIIGDVSIGDNTWIGPNVILDGSGGLIIGSNVSISAGVQIYTHDNIDQSTSLGVTDIVHAPTTIGNGVYIGPNAVIQKGCKIGDYAIIGALSFVNTDIPEGAKVIGIPARIMNVE